MRTRTTIEDVARRAGVSIKTVSRVTNNEPNVRGTTRERVERAIAELRYVPDPSARSLASRRSFLVGLLYDNHSSSYLVSIQNGSLRTSRAAGYDLIIHPCAYQDDALESDIEHMIRRSKVEGLILTPPLSDMPRVFALLGRLGVPFVRIAPADGGDADRAVYTNDAEACAEMTDYLVGLGHERIGFILGHPDHKAVMARYEGYRDGLKSAGLRYSKSLVFQGDFTFDSGLAGGERLLGLADRPTAIIASNDDMAAGVMHVAHSMGLAIPGDLSVAGFDDIPVARQLWPALTTVRQPMEAMASAATTLLLRHLGSPTASQSIAKTIPSELVKRQSTGPAPGSKR